MPTTAIVLFAFEALLFLRHYYFLWCLKALCFLIPRTFVVAKGQSGHRSSPGSAEWSWRRCGLRHWIVLNGQ